MFEEGHCRKQPSSIFQSVHEWLTIEKTLFYSTCDGLSCAHEQDISEPFHISLWSRWMQSKEAVYVWAVCFTVRTATNISVQTNDLSPVACVAKQKHLNCIWIRYICWFCGLVWRSRRDEEHRKKHHSFQLTSLHCLKNRLNLAHTHPDCDMFCRGMNIVLLVILFYWLLYSTGSGRSGLFCSL